MDNKKTLIILGNGYDMACELKSSYNDFLKSKQFTDLVSNLAPESYNKSLFSFIGKEKERRGWCDLEEDLFNYSEEITQKQENVAVFQDEYNKLKLALQDYLVGIDNSVDKKDNQYLWDLHKQWNKENDIIGIISLNYTAYSKIRFPQISKNLEVSYPHGFIMPKVAKDVSKVVLGIDESMKVSPEHAFLYKNLDKNINRNLVLELVSKAEKLIFYGCSFCKTDTWLYQTLFHNNIKDIEIYDVNICNILKEIIKQCPKKLYQYVSYISMLPKKPSHS